MSLNDPLASALSAVQNAERVGKKECRIYPASNLIKGVLKILNDNQYIGNLEKQGDTDAYKINLLGHVNKCGVVKPRFSIKLTDFEQFEKRFLPARNFGVLIVSTPQGLMTNTEAKEKHLGGRLIAYCY